MPMNTQVTKIYEDDNLIVVDKPAGLVVHPGAGMETETLVDWLKTHEPNITALHWPDPSRPGIVHRLDKDTSGLIILAKNPAELLRLQKLFSENKVKKTYFALIFGKLDTPEGTIESLIGRNPSKRREQISKSIFFDFEPGKKRSAKTSYETSKEYEFNGETLTLVKVNLETGRMHQIRVHFKSIGHPIIGDQTYNIKPSRKISEKLGLNRQFLHAFKLEFDNLKFESELPNDLKEVLDKLEAR